MTAETQHPAFLDASDRRGIERVVDVLLPGTEQVPSGCEVGVHSEWLDRVLGADPRLIEVVRTVAGKAASSRHCTLSDIEAWADGRVEDVVFALNSAYYMSPRVQAALGYPGQARRPVTEATPEELCSDELIAPVLQRGPIYVATPS